MLKLILAISYIASVYLAASYLSTTQPGINWIGTAGLGLLLLPAIIQSITRRDRALACCVGAGSLAGLISLFTNIVDSGYIAHGVATWTGVMVMCSFHKRWMLAALALPLIVYNLTQFAAWGPRIPIDVITDPYHIGNWLYALWCFASMMQPNRTDKTHDTTPAATIESYQTRRAA